ncbi:retrotransposon protein, putative, ty3-gypsy subclass [Tanacetum coccineum]
MVNTRTDAELAAAVQAAVDAMLPQIREQVREEYRAGASGGSVLRRTGKNFVGFFISQSSDHVHVYTVYGCLLRLRMLPRNLESFVTGMTHDRHKSGDRYHPYSQQGSHKSHGQSDDRQRSDRQGSDRQGGGGNYRNNNNNNYSRDKTSNLIESSLCYRDMNSNNHVMYRNSGVDTTMDKRFPSNPGLVIFSETARRTLVLVVGHADRSQKHRPLSLHLLRIRPPILQQKESLWIGERLRAITNGKTDVCDESRSFLGLACYYRYSVRGFLTISITLNPKLMRKARSRRWLELLKDYDTNIQYHLGKANVVADALSRKSSIIAGIKSGGLSLTNFHRSRQAQKDDGEIWAFIQNIDQQTEFRVDDDAIYGQWILDYAYEEDVSRSKQHFCRVVKIEHQRASGLLQPLEIPVWKWDEISMDFVTGLPRTQRKHDAIWVVVDRLTKSAHFLPIRKDYPKAWGTRLKFSTAFHPETDGQSERTIQTLEDMLRSCALEWAGNWDDYICLVEFAYNNSWHASIKCAPFEMLYGRKCRAPICWDQVGERILEGREILSIILFTLFYPFVQIVEDLSYTEEPESILDVGQQS